MAVTIQDRESWLAEASVEEMRRMVDALYRVHRLVSLVNDLDALLENIVAESKQVANAEAGSLLLYDRPANDLYFHVALGESGNQQALKQNVRLKLGEGFAGIAAQTRESVNVGDAASDSRFYGEADALSEFRTRSLLAVPLVDKEELVGVLEVMNKSGGGSFTEVDRRAMEMFSSLAASVVRNARLIDEKLRAERLAALGEAVAGLSHYIRNIIGGLTGSVELVDHGLEKDDVGVLKKGWAVLKRSVDRIAGVVEDMLAFSKPRKPVFEACDVAELLSDAVESFRGLIARKEIDIDVDAAQVAGTLDCDPRGIHRCLLNLLTNAGHAVPKVGGRISVRAWSPDAGTVKIEVADNGLGISPGDRTRIFEPFYSSKGSQGTGLGLAVTRKIVGEHGGVIEANEGPEGGAAFYITLPSRSGNA